VTKQQTLHHYVLVRADLPKGVALAQTIHAAGESCDGPLPSGTYAYALSVKDEDQLYEYADRLWDAEIPHKVIVETDGEYAGQAMTLGLFPTRDKDSVRRILSELPLAR
jgi:hypothetical protein